MKILKNLFTYSIMCCLILVSCTQDSKYTEDQLKNIPTKSNSDYEDVFPEGTHFKDTYDRIVFTLPEGYTLLGVNDDGVSELNGSGSITCECTEGEGGCNPFKAGSKVGCDLSKSCSECKAKRGDASGSHVYEEFHIIDNNTDESDFSKIDDIIGKKLLPIELLDFKPISSKIDELIGYHSNNDYQLQTSVANIFGYAVIIELPLAPDFDGPLLLTNGGGGGAISCECLSSGNDAGSGSCPKKSAKLGAIKYCDAKNCSKCELSFIVTHDDNETRLYVDENGYIVD